MSGTGSDLRLALAAAFAWLVLALCHSRAPSTLVLLACVTAIVAGAVLALRMPGARAVALAACCAAVLLVPAAARDAVARASPLAQLAARRAALTLEVKLDGDPSVLASTGPSGVSRMVVPAEVDALVRAGRREPLAGDLVVLGPAAGWLGLLPGQHVLADGRMLPPDGAGQTPAFSTNQPPTPIGQPPWWQRAAGQVRDALRHASAVLPAEERGLLPGLVDGDTAALDPVLASRFKVAGLTHLVAVSGANA